MPATPHALLESLAKKYLSIETLETRKSDALDFHDVHVTEVQNALKDAYREGQKAGGKKMHVLTPLTGAEQKVIDAIAKEHLSIDSLKEQKSDRLDFHDIGVGGVEAALDAAYQAGAKSGGGKVANEDALRAEVLKLANAKPALRQHLLPVLRKADEEPEDEGMKTEKTHGPAEYW